MKKICRTLLAVCLIAALTTGCGVETTQQHKTEATQIASTQEETTEAETTEAETTEAETTEAKTTQEITTQEDTTAEEGTQGEDIVDLTVLSSTMVYSEVYNMMITPRDYEGRTVKMKGQFSFYEDTEKNQNYYAVIIADAMACCQQGLEFVLSGDYEYPEDYPAVGTEITVTGIFETYEEDGFDYCRLKGSSMEINE